MDTKQCRQEFEEWFVNEKNVDDFGKELAWNAYQHAYGQGKSTADAAIIAAAKNLVRQKGRHNSETAYQQLEAAVAAAKGKP